MGENPGNGDERVWNLLRLVGWSLAALIMLMPAVGMLFTDEVNWTLSDFIFAAIILGGIGLIFELAIRQSRDNAYRTGVVMGLAAMFLLIWSNAAVGFIGSGANAANILYAAMVAIPIIGGIVALFKARGMYVTMVVTAIVQALVTLFAFMSDLVREEETWLILAINGVFIALWLGASMLFRRAAENEQRRAA